MGKYFWPVSVYNNYQILTSFSYHLTHTCHSSMFQCFFVVIKKKSSMGLSWPWQIPPVLNVKTQQIQYQIMQILFINRCRHGRDRMVDRSTGSYAISAYHHWSCEFESHPGDVYSVQHYVIKFVGDLRQVGGFLRVFRLPPPIKLTATI